MTTKKTTKKFQLVSKYANYATWDEKQNAPYLFVNLVCSTNVILKIQPIYTSCVRYEITKI